MSLFVPVPQNHILTSGANSALTWTNAVSVSSMNVSSLGASALAVSTLTTSSSVNASTLTTGRLNYSSIVGSSISTNAMTLSLTNASTQNTQVYQTVNSSITTSFSAIQASFVSSGTTYNTLALNPNGGNVGIGTTNPTGSLYVAGSGILTSGIRSNQYNIITGATTLTVSQMGGMIECGGSSPYTVTLPSPTGGASATNGYMTFQVWINTTSAVTFSTPSGSFYGQCGNGTSSIVLPNANNQLATFASDGYNWGVWMTVSPNSSGNVGIGTTAPQNTLHVFNNTTSSIYAPDGDYRSGQIVISNSKTGISPYSMAIGMDQVSGIGFINVAGNGGTQPICLNTRGGNVGIGTTAPGNTLDVLGSFRVRGAPNASTYSQSLTVTTYNGGGPYSSYTSIQAAHEGSAANELSLNRGGGNITMGGTVVISPLTTNGTVITINSIGQLSVSSDRRIKENIVYQSDTQQGLASVLNLKPATYTMIGSSGSYLGFIAQDLEQEIPLAVDGKKYEWQWETTEDGKPKFDANGDIVYKLDADGNRIVRPRGVSDRAIIATQTLAIQELSKKLDATQQQLAAKSAALDSLLAWAQTMGYPASS